MKRRLFTILSALSLLLFVAVVVLWVRSRSDIAFAEFETREDAGEHLLYRHYEVSVPRGRLAFVYTMAHADPRFTVDEWWEPGGDDGGVRACSTAWDVAMSKVTAHR